MIKQLTLKNFKCFEQQAFDFKNLTLLSGLNSSGKSSIIHSLLLLRQSYQQNLLPHQGLALNGELVRIGTAQDALFEGATEDLISLELALNNGIVANWTFNYNKAVDVLELNAPVLDSKIYDYSLFDDSFQYLQAERIGSRTYLEISDFQVRQHKQLGSQGEYTAYFLSVYRSEKIASPVLKHPAQESLLLINQVEAWLGEISPGTRINVQASSQLDLVSLKYFYGLSNPYRATNVGFGISYTLPIIVAILSAQPGSLILLENPEAHLHPKGQAKMGELLALDASCGIQIVVETHSDHVLNGLRLAVYHGKLSPDDVQLHYLERFERRGESKTKVISPHIDKQGRIDEWPDGFFDEWDKSLEALLTPLGED
ncbi:AAA family ATPase [Spirulina subsalsa]|uniref:AAA family ATPase n=1 Tax=Spirulina subsalsa TaxID=54311 RepID=UPI0002DBF683|nr:DUF3696 domain-containing protein [Spirulina subsalsa]